MDTVKPVISVKTGSIGPHHDPYGTELVSVRVGPREASWYSDGLGTNKVWLTEGAELKRELKWIDVTYSKDSVNKDALARILFRRWVGISCDDAKQSWYEYDAQVARRDPFGGRDPYYGGP